MTRVRRVFVCSKCKKKKVAPSATGRFPKLCAKCNPRKKADAKREGLRKRAKRDSKRRQATAEEIHNAGRLAVGLSLYDSIPNAARWAGIDPDVANLRSLSKLAQTHHSEVINGNVGDLGKRLVGLMNLILISTANAIDEISPRDRLNALRQLASARDLLIGQAPSTDFAQINLTVVGSEGKTIVLGENEHG